ncbi:uncharacterized protein LOC133805613 [Humulus lupulus]|uniref:uncharacterized protein LOC133805613 n=1 Tax=Humulus lupulus TaxID=3486 RepID=UPI002B411B54|nr:uncharacterized protein LOC133805613 [Humulus lupulus]
MKRNFKSIQNSSTSIGKNDKITKSSYAGVNINLEDLESDPGLRTPIMDHPLKIRDQVRRAYMQKGPCQPHLKPFPSTKVGTQSRAFNCAWYEEFQNWLEYSVSKDGAFCLYCYLFKSNCGGQSGGDSFVGQGFRNFKNGKARLYTHVERCDILREKQDAIISEALKCGEISSGRGLNQETNLKRPSDTRWGSHYATLVSLINLFSPITNVLQIIVDDGRANSEQSLHLMKAFLGITNELSKALQRKDQDIANAMKLVEICKKRLQAMRDNEWDSFLNQVSTFCAKYNVDVLDMDDTFVAQGRSRRKTQEMTNLHHYRVEFFFVVIDIQLQELNERFNEVNTELLLCLASLCPGDSFVAFDKKKLARFAEYYPKDFSTFELMILDDQLETYIIDVRTTEKFLGLKSIGDLTQKMVKTKKDIVYPLVYRLITLALILPVVTATVERVFSSMNILKNRLRNRMGDQWMNDCLLVYIEKDIFNSLDNEVIMQRFQNMKTRRGRL